jgi:hypothetical protein
MSHKPASTVPRAMPIHEALEASAPLANLARRLRESNARFESIRGGLPPALQAHVRPGPVDEEGWALLAENASVAAKLRHLMPRLEEALRDAGWATVALRIRVQSG